MKEAGVNIRYTSCISCFEPFRQLSWCAGLRGVRTGICVPCSQKRQKARRLLEKHILKAKKLLEENGYRVLEKSTEG